MCVWQNKEHLYLHIIPLKKPVAFAPISVKFSIWVIIQLNLLSDCMQDSQVYPQKIDLTSRQFNWTTNKLDQGEIDPSTGLALHP